MNKPKPKLYFDTSVPSNFYDTYPAEQVAMTRLFWNETLSLFKPYISPVTLQEIKNTPKLVKRQQILNLVNTFSVLPEARKAAIASLVLMSQKIYLFL